jgi:hypothetical protein
MTIAWKLWAVAVPSKADKAGEESKQGNAINSA